MWNILPVQVRFMRQGTQGLFTGMTQRDRIGREVEGIGGHMYTHGCFMWMYGKDHLNIVK